MKFCLNSPRFDAQRIAKENDGSCGNIWEPLVMALTASPAENVIQLRPTPTRVYRRLFFVCNRATIFLCGWFWSSSSELLCPLGVFRPPVTLRRRRGHRDRCTMRLREDAEHDLGRQLGSGDSCPGEPARFYVDRVRQGTALHHGAGTPDQ